MDAFSGDAVVIAQGTYECIHEGGSASCVHVPHDVKLSDIAPAFARFARGCMHGEIEQQDGIAHRAIA